MLHLEKIKHKIISEGEAHLLTKRSLNGKKVFTNGCFDLIHKGHIEYLSKAADLGDHLIIGLNTDSSVKQLKGDNRPVKDEITRAMVLAAFEFVSAVILFSDDTPYQLINFVKPDVLVKGGDYDPDCTDTNDPKYIVGSDLVKNNGGVVKTISFVEGHSTTGLINKMG